MKYSELKKICDKNNCQIITIKNNYLYNDIVVFKCKCGEVFTKPTVLFIRSLNKMCTTCWKNTLL